MTTIKNFFSLLLFVAIATAFTTTASAQSAGSGDPAIVFNAEDISQWNVNTIPSSVPDGKTVLATNTTDRTQIIAVVRGGKIAQIGLQSPGAKFKILTPSTGGPCSYKHCFANQVNHCYQTPSGCVCVCGAWITLYPGN